MEKLPDFHQKNIADLFTKEEIVKATAAQIIKDLAMHSVDLEFSGEVEDAYEELLQKLSVQIELLQQFDPNRLLSILYQVDISEKEMVREEPELIDFSTSELLAHKIIVRDLKKVLLRIYYKSKDL